MKTIVVTGPESTGKTVISEYLSGRLGCTWIPEYAREYIGGLNRPYKYSDLEHIAGIQVQQRKELEEKGASMLILDTWLIITKVWFQEVFNKYPGWLDKEINEGKIDLFLVCSTDIPWIPDPLRENGGEKREYLMKRYIEEIKKTGSNYSIISGSGSERCQNAFYAATIHFNLTV